MRREILICLLLVGATVAVYGQTLRFDFVNWDDPHYVTGNARVQKGLTAENFESAFADVLASNWHPLTALSHMLDVELFGLDPAGHHAVNVLLHVANVLLLFDLRRYDEAVVQFEAILRIQPDHAVARNSLGRARSAQGLDELAVLHFRRAVDLGIERAATHYELGNLLRRRGDLGEALHHYGRALELDPDHEGAARALAELREREPPPDGRASRLE